MGWVRAALSDAMGQRFIYRNLAPVDPALMGLDKLWPLIGLEAYRIPRKTSAEYARAVWHIMQQAQELRGEQRPLTRVLLIGDSARNDGAVARNMASERAARAFIGLEDPAQPKRIEITGVMMTANRWNALADMMTWLQRTGFACDEGTGVLVDLDKTSMGARGRNDRTIDLARVRAAERAAREAIGPNLDVESFSSLYARLNRAECHWLTEDNQDYVAYLSLMVAGGACPQEEFWPAMEERQFSDVLAFSEFCESRAAMMTAQLRELHHQVREGLLRQDPTPFKTFRQLEFLETIALMDVLPDGAPAEEVLSQEIVITAEIMQVCRLLSSQGALVFGLSDKPDEASLPTAEAASRGALAIHDTRMKVYGEPLF